MINYNKVIEAVLTGKYTRATQYISPNFIVRAVRKLCGKRIDKRDKSVNIVLTVGKPNYLEREFIKLCHKAKEPFPIKKVQLKLYNPKKNKLKRK